MKAVVALLGPVLAHGFFARVLYNKCYYIHSLYNKSKNKKIPYGCSSPRSVPHATPAVLTLFSPARFAAVISLFELMYEVDTVW